MKAHLDETLREETMKARRRVLLQGLALATAALAGCGGGGGGGDSSTPPPSGGPSPSPPSSGPSGSVVYRNSGMAGVYRYAGASAISFDPGSAPFTDPGVAVSSAGVISVARAGDDSGFSFALYNLDGTLRSEHTVAREFAFQTSAVRFNADGTRVAFSVDEPASATNNTRIARTLVADWASGSIIAAFDGLEEPCWAGTAGELLLRDPETLQLHLVNASLADTGALANVTVSNLVGGYDVSADGRYIATEDGNTIAVYDRSNGTRVVAAHSANSSTHSPTFSPDGRFLAILARDLTAYVPHVLPFSTGGTVEVVAATHALSGTLADCAGRIGWTA